MAGYRSPYTPTEQRILEVLSDGERHSCKDLAACLSDEFSDINSLHVTMHNLRKKLPKHERIVCEYYLRNYYYRRFIHLKSKEFCKR